MVEDVDGNVFLDCAAGIAVNSTGHAHPDVVKAIVEQSARFLHMSGTDFYYEPQVRLAEELAAVTPIAGGVRSFFGNSGTEAVEACLKLSRYASGRQNFIAFLGGFHGRSMGSLSLTASKAIQRRGFGPLLPGVYHAPFPDCYRCPLGLTTTDCAAEAWTSSTIDLRACVAGRSRGDRCRAYPGEGGYAVAPDQFRSGCASRRHGILLVADEVQSGMGARKMFAIELSGRRAGHDGDGQGHCVGLPLGVAGRAPG
jgi:4-aminobutyrate aminotransferase